MTPDLSNNTRSDYANKTDNEMFIDYLRSLFFLPIKISNVKFHFLSIFIISYCQNATFYLYFLVSYGLNVNFLIITFLLTKMFIINLIFTLSVGFICKYFVKKSKDTGFASYAYNFRLSTSFIIIYFIFFVNFMNYDKILKLIFFPISFCNGYFNMKREVTFKNEKSEYIFTIIMLLFYIMWFSTFSFF